MSQALSALLVPRTPGRISSSSTGNESPRSEDSRRKRTTRNLHMRLRSKKQTSWIQDSHIIPSKPSPEFIDNVTAPLSKPLEEAFSESMDIDVPIVNSISASASGETTETDDGNVTPSSLPLLHPFLHTPFRIGHIINVQTICRHCVHIANPSLPSPSEPLPSLSFLTKNPPDPRFPKSTIAHRTIMFLANDAAPGTASIPTSFPVSHPNHKPDPVPLVTRPTKPLNKAAILPWKKPCRCRDKRCHSVRTIKGYPKRLVEISLLQGTWGPNGGIAIRVVPTDISVNRGNYLYLAYCPGEITEHESFTTPETEARNQQEVPWYGLPKIWRDAVKVSISLGIRYIWIDALCETPQDQLRPIIEHAVATLLPASPPLFQNNTLITATGPNAPGDPAGHKDAQPEKTTPRFDIARWSTEPDTLALVMNADSLRVVEGRGAFGRLVEEVSGDLKILHGADLDVVADGLLGRDGVYIPRLKTRDKRKRRASQTTMRPTCSVPVESIPPPSSPSPPPETPETPKIQTPQQSPPPIQKQRQIFTHPVTVSPIRIPEPSPRRPIARQTAKLWSKISTLWHRPRSAPSRSS